MVYFQEDELLQRAGGLTAAAAQESLRAASKQSGSFDVFLSHSVRDARLVLGVRRLLEAQGLSVYVDWIDDPQLDRGSVSPSTAARLRVRMGSSRTMVYATSRAAQSSRWMPWELGYFDGFHGPQRVSILPIEGPTTGSFAGQEYLGLYSVVDRVVGPYGAEPSVVLHESSNRQSFRSFAGRTR